MFLQSLELFGFKSFANRTKLSFSRGVTAIVGPNGCGKSNVLDAIRWVLGEQSAKALRGAEMADVIFNGSDALAAVGFAEVSMTFAECERELGTEFHEVKLTRRVFRDGKSEYLINGTSCRLKDIQQLFMDTGIGRSAYSIMEQGKIDQLLSSRPEDRRAVFEEAAGITRYKAQKREALRKLEQTEQNLVRLDDILKEVQRQLGSLTRQAAKARRWQEISTQLRTLETHLADNQYRDWKSRLEDLQKRATEAREASETAERTATEAEEQLQEKQLDLQERDEVLSRARGFANDVKSRLTQAQSRLGFNKERMIEAGTLIERLKNEIEGAREKQRQQAERLAETDSQEQELNETLRAQQALLDNAAAELQGLRLRRNQAEGAAQRAAQTAVSAEGKLQYLRTEVARAQAGEQGAEVRVQQLAAEVAGLGPLRLQAAAALTESREAQAENQRAVESRREGLRLAEAEQSTAQRELQAIEPERANASRLVASLQSKVDVLKQLNVEGEGLGGGAKALLRGLDRPDHFKPATLGALATMLEAEPACITAIEAVLGEALQTVLFSDSEIAREALETLSARSLGKASVAPQSTRTPSFHALDLALPPGAVGFAREKVKAIPAAEWLVDELLRGVVLAPNLATAVGIVAAQPEFTVVTLAGEVLGRDGVWRGGRASGKAQESSILQRKAQITELEGQLEGARAELASTETRRETAQAKLVTAQQALREEREALQAAQIRISELAGKAALLEREERDLARREETLKREQEQTAQRAQQARDRAAALALDVNAASAAVDAAQTEIGLARQQVEELRRHETERNDALSEQRARFAAEQRGRDDLSRQRQELAARRDEWVGVVNERSKELERYESRMEQYTAENAGLDEAIEIGTLELEDAEKETERLALARLNVASVISELDGVARASRREASVLHDQKGELEVQMTQLRLRQENLSEKIAQKYQVDLALFLPTLDAFHAAFTDRRGKDAPAVSGDAMWAEVDQIVQTLQERLNSIGTVNVDAIQEHDELEQRHTFLQTQRDDLTKSRDELQGIIAKINATTLELFTATFERIRTNFAEMFTELFGGGRGNLVLSDENDPLESGIEIMARPPGKQTQSITLLSGGEKTMTAVSLLFAIYMVKPSPFCVLDEMDAPLDESNIGRFIKMLDRFVQQSQFLVITHNKRTIARADVLYGVTMEQAGVSKPVAVRLTGVLDEPAPTPASATPAPDATPRVGDEEHVALAV